MYIILIYVDFNVEKLHWHYRRGFRVFYLWTYFYVVFSKKNQRGVADRFDEIQWKLVTCHVNFLEITLLFCSYEYAASVCYRTFWVHRSKVQQLLSTIWLFANFQWIWICSYFWISASACVIIYFSNSLPSPYTAYRIKMSVFSQKFWFIRLVLHDLLQMWWHLATGFSTKKQFDSYIRYAYE